MILARTYPSLLAALGLMVAAGACVADSTNEEELDALEGEVQTEEEAACVAPAPTAIDERRSLAVTDEVILTEKRFGLARVLQQIIDTAGSGSTPIGLFAQWMNFFNPELQGENDPRPRCSDHGQTVNGYPIDCRAAPSGEGIWGDPLNSPLLPAATERFKPIGLFNRFDLAPKNGAHCGEYRIVYGKEGGPGRDLLIFEAVLPNPKPECGVSACREVASFWARLSQIDDPLTRAAHLEDFYFKGIDGFSPVVHVKHYGPAGGQIRVNLFRIGKWQLRDFQTSFTSEDSVEQFIIQPASVKGNPFVELFDVNRGHPLAPEYQQHFLTQIPSLEAGDIDLIGMSTPDVFNAGQSTSQFGFSDTNDYATFVQGDGAFQQAIEAQSKLGWQQIANRATATSCGGCHQTAVGADLGNNLTWPASLGFVHVGEFTEAGPDGPRFAISDALISHFLPHRKSVLSSFLANQACQPLVCPVPVDPADTENIGDTKFAH